MMKKRFLFRAVFLAVMLSAALVQGQQITIQTDAGKEFVLGRAEIEALPRSKVTTGASDAPTTFEGVSVASVLDKAGASLAKSGKAKPLASCLLVEAADGYRVVIALPETDPAFTDKQIVLAFLKNGKPLEDKEGPYRIVIPGEKKMARWVRQVTMLKIVDVQ